jgi:hypothetical protein
MVRQFPRSPQRGGRQTAGDSTAVFPKDFPGFLIFLFNHYNLYLIFLIFILSSQSIRVGIQKYKGKVFQFIFFSFLFFILLFIFLELIFKILYTYTFLFLPLYFED